MTLEYFQSYGCSDKAKELYDELSKLLPHESHRIIDLFLSNNYRDSELVSLFCCDKCGERECHESTEIQSCNELPYCHIQLCEGKCIEHYVKQGIVVNKGLHGYWRFKCTFHSRTRTLFSMLLSHLVLKHHISLE